MNLTTLRNVFLPIAMTASLLLPSTASAITSVKSWAYKPFSVTSTSLKKEMGDDYIAEKLMCKTPVATMQETMDLFQNYDLVGTDKTDGTVTLTTFRGKQEGRPVNVVFAVEASTKLLRYVWVGGKPALHCQ